MLPGPEASHRTLESVSHPFGADLLDRNRLEAGDGPPDLRQRLQIEFSRRWGNGEEGKLRGLPLVVVLASEPLGLDVLGQSEGLFAADEDVVSHDVAQGQERLFFQDSRQFGVPCLPERRPVADRLALGPEVPRAGLGGLEEVGAAGAVLLTVKQCSMLVLVFPPLSLIKTFQQITWLELAVMFAELLNL